MPPLRDFGWSVDAACGWPATGGDDSSHGLTPYDSLRRWLQDAALASELPQLDAAATVERLLSQLSLRYLVDIGRDIPRGTRENGFSYLTFLFTPSPYPRVAVEQRPPLLIPKALEETLKALGAADSEGTGGVGGDVAGQEAQASTNVHACAGIAVAQPQAHV